jgi:hypothetical protein
MLDLCRNYGNTRCNCFHYTDWDETMYLNTTTQMLEVVSIGGTKSGDTIDVFVDYIGKDSSHDLMKAVFYTAIDRPDWSLGSNWFILDTRKSHGYIVNKLRSDAISLRSRLRWPRPNGSQVDREWIDQHVEFAVHSAPDNYKTGWGQPPAKGELVIGQWLQVLPIVDGMKARNVNVPRDSFCFPCPVVDVTNSKVSTV